MESKQFKKIYHAAIYVRLSKEDGDVAGASKSESNSISNQRELIRDFLKDKEDIVVVSERVDDGYSGSSFERPSFKLMMEDIKKGVVDCVVVKDLSRFGREYIDSGRYIERLFPAMGVRFIAVNDHYDSLKGDDQGDEILVPFKNLINDAYCRDISVKIRSHLEVKRKNGEFIGAFAPYGYQKDGEDHHRLVVDTYAAEGIRVPKSFVFGKGMGLEEVIGRAEGIGYPLFVKPVKAGSSYGVSKVYNAEGLPGAVEAAFAYDGKVIVEEEIAGFEVGCAVMGEDVLAAGEVDEIELSDGFFDFEEKYTLKTSAIHVPARIPREKAEEIRQAAKRIYRALDCRGFARVDMFLEETGEIVFNEVNTIPGFTSHSRFPNMMKAVGISFTQIVSCAIEEALGREVRG